VIELAEDRYLFLEAIDDLRLHSVDDLDRDIGARWIGLVSRTVDEAHPARPQLFDDDVAGESTRRYTGERGACGHGWRIERRDLRVSVPPQGQRSADQGAKLWILMLELIQQHFPVGLRVEEPFEPLADGRVECLHDGVSES